jgi:hypothetical protein
LIGQAVKPDRRRIRHLFYAPKRLQEFPVKAALRRDNEMIDYSPVGNARRNTGILLSDMNKETRPRATPIKRF